MPPSSSPNSSYGETHKPTSRLGHIHDDNTHAVVTPPKDKQSSIPHIQCPFCLRPQTHRLQNLICSSCNHESLELIRNSVINNDQFNETARTEIDDIFRIFHDVKHGDLDQLTSLTNSHRQLTRVEQESGNVPYASVKSIKFLCLQLIKLEIINHKIKLKNIDRSQEVTNQKIRQLEQKLKEKNLRKKSDQETITKKKLQVSNQFKQIATHLHLQTVDYEIEKLYQIERQACKLQASHFQVMKDIIFTYKSSIPSKKTSISSNMYQKSRNTKRLLLFHQPIIPLKEFLSYNNKIISINEFLESLIRLQIELYDIFKIGNNLMHLPYLEELKKYLPDSDFYNLVQEKENFMINGGNVPPEQSESVVNDKDVQPIEIKEINVDNERIIKLGGEIKLPLSSKTINYQLRKASLNNTTSPTRDKGQSPPVSKPGVLRGTEDEPIKDYPNVKSDKGVTPKHPSNLLKDNLKGKKMIIVPHKILTKPFTKLTTKEYLRFLSIIVKLLVNFKIFFSLTIDLLPDPIKQKYQFESGSTLQKKTSNASISSTINGSRMNNQRLSVPYGDGVNSSSVIFDDRMYDFEYILDRISNMHKFLDAKRELFEKRQEHAQALRTHVGTEFSQGENQGIRSTSNTTQNSTSGSTATTGGDVENVSSATSLASTPSNSNFSSAMNSIIKVDNFERLDRDKQNNNRKSSLKSLYNNIFRDFRSKGSQAEDDKDNHEQDIYGNFSETHGVAASTENLSDVNSAMTNSSPLNDSTLGTTGNHDKPDLRMIMEQVYRLITNGSSRNGEYNQIANLKPAAFNLNSAKTARKPPSAIPKVSSKLGADTMSMMAESKLQLEDWDTISKMY